MNEPCPPSLQDLLDQTLTEPERLAVERHVENCKTCQAWLENASGKPDSAIPELPEQLPAEAMARWLAPQISAVLKPGSQVGAYRIDGTIGSGGMGIVYRATDTTLGRSVAVKVLMSTLNPESAARFVREVQAAARVQHDHIVQVFAAVNPPTGPAHLVMEFVDGPTLREASAKARGLESRRSAEIVSQIADALAAVHAAGLVHRDVKPANVLLDQATGRAKLADFGLARVSESSQLTRSGMLVGTPVYMAPEQVRNPMTAGPLVDVYGLGATLYETLTGAEPFRGSLELLLAQVLADEPIPPRRLNPAIPRDLDTICLKAMSKDPASRYPTADAMRDDLRRWLAGEPIVARPLSWFGRGRRLAKRNPVVAGLLATLAIGAVVSFAVVTWLWLDSKASAEAAKKSAELAKSEQAKADQDYRAAEQVVNHFYQKLYDKGTVAAAINIETRLELIREAIAFYEQVAARRPGEKPPAELAAAYARKGALHNLLKETEPAAASFRSALALFEQAEREGQVSDQFRREHAECLFYLAVSAGRSRDARGAMAYYEAAINRLTPLAATDPQAGYFLGGSLGNLASVYEYLGEIEKARATHDRVLLILRETRKANPKNGGALQDLIWTSLSVAGLQPDAKTSLEQLLAARTLVEDYSREYPTDFNRAEVGCSYHTEFTLAYLRLNRTEDALEATQKSLEMAKVMAGYPAQFRHPATQAAAWRAAAMAQAAYGDKEASTSSWTKAAELYDSLDWNTIRSATNKHLLAQIYDTLAKETSDPKAAEGFRQRATETREQLQKEHPEFRGKPSPQAD
ncbi:MAG: protein kinase domain-containing protein [Fimbriiglobus sp.]